MKKPGYLSHITIDAVWHGEDVVLDIDIISIGETGIGPYEFWGAKGYDHGVDVIEEWCIKNVMDEAGNPLPKAENKALIKEMELDDKFMDGLDETLQEKLADLVDDGGEDED